ncbi:MAG: cytochrome c3 family protein [Anaeromyxobacteraceae bacterium]
MKKVLLLTFAAAFAAAAQAAGSVAGSRHDLSASGPGPFRAVSERSPCVFCHTSHGSGPGLTGRPDPADVHRGYESSTARTPARAPTGASRICLSCHDGTIAVGQTRSGRIQMVGGAGAIPAGHRANLGTDLRGSHPVSIRPNVAAGTHTPSPQSGVHYDASGELQCTSCHDPHSENGGDPVVGKFLVARSANSGLCLSCHDPLSTAASGSSHTLATAPMPASLSHEGARTMAEAGCSACHPSHAADPGGRLLRPGRSDDDTCLTCHAATGASKALGADLSRPWSHASSGRGNHDAAERSAGESGGKSGGIARARRHVTCVDCHDPHRANPRPAQPPAASGLLAGAWGVDLNGRQIDPARFEYEVCLKCHGDTAPIATLTNDGVRRAVQDANLRLVFSPSSPSFHPVAAPGRNSLVPGLKPPYTTASMIYCTDCHASDQSPAAGGAGARGPHGSIYPHLLERNYSTNDPTPETPSAYALCYKCHDRETLLSESPSPIDGTGFPGHRSHVAGQSASCATCHDGHGVSMDAGSARENAHLISFNTAAVSANSAGRAVYTSTSPRHGSCNLTCHGVPHDGGAAFSY